MTPIYATAFGIGDAVMSAYVAEGYRQAGLDILLHTRHPEWLPCAELKTAPLPDAPPWSIYDRYSEEITVTKTRSSRPDWLSQRASEHLGIPYATPARPSLLPVGEPTIRGPYVLLSPFSAYSCREWPLPHWLQLVKILSREIRVVVIAQEQKQIAPFQHVPCEFFWGQSPSTILSMIRHAFCLIGNDSGMVHVAGLLGSPALSILAQIRPEALYGLAPSVRWLTPDSPCAGCHWSGELFVDLCNQSCSALMAISPHRVAEAVCALLTTAG